MPMILVVQDFPCRVCNEPTPHVYHDKEEELVCMKCRSKGIHTAVKLGNPAVVIGRYMQN